MNVELQGGSVLPQLQAGAGMRTHQRGPPRVVYSRSSPSSVPRMFSVTPGRPRVAVIPITFRSLRTLRRRRIAKHNTMTIYAN